MAHLSANDVIPPLRHNLAFKDIPQGLGGGFLSVKNFDTGEETYLRGFEYSLARMLDGRRTAKEVVAAAEDVGLPVTLEDLEAFLKKMSDRNLVGPDPTAIDNNPFASRARWSPQTRELYRLALRKGRSGNLDQALSALSVLLSEDPTVIEAQNLRLRLREQLRSGGTQLPFRTVLAQTERNWRLDGMGADVVVKARPLPTAGPRGLAMAAGASLTVALLALAAMLLPFPHQVNTTAALVPIASTQLTAPRTGMIESVAVKQGQWVEKGAVLFNYDANEPLTQLAAAVGRLESLQQRAMASFPTTPLAREAQQSYQRAEAEVAWAQADLERARTEGRPGQLEAAEDSVNRALSAVSAAYQTMNAMMPRAQLDELDLQRQQVRTLQRQVTESEVRAPASGAITTLGVQPGQRVASGTLVAQLDDLRKLKAVATVESADARALELGLPVLVRAQDRATSAEVTRIDGLQIEVLVDNTARIFEPSLAQLQIRGKAVPLLP